MRKYESPIAEAVSLDVVDVIAASWDTLTTWGDLLDELDGSESPGDSPMIWE